MMSVHIPAWLKKIAEAFRQKSYQFYVVGGGVRDSLLDREVAEWDAATDAKPASAVCTAQSPACPGGG